jgi:alpha-galactosidase
MREKNEEFILTPTPRSEPRINGAKIFGVRPSSPFLFKVAATGDKPLTFTADNLPKGLSINQQTGLITGVIHQKGSFEVLIQVSNKHGKAERILRIEVGEKICLTPPMGWNSWYVYSLWVSQEKIEEIATAMVEKDLINHGWTYVNIDDCWQGTRDMNGSKALQPNAKFPDMKKMVDFIHELGFKAGIYSTPWVGSYAGYIGGSIPNPTADYSEWTIDPKERVEKYQLFGNGKANRRKLRFFGEEMAAFDVKQWADWGFDYLKYDWMPNDIEHITAMQLELLKSGRDIIYSLSNHASIKIANELIRLANVWRTTTDIRDDWFSISRIGFSQSKWAPFSGPGHWNDPDMLQIGNTAHPHSPTLDIFPTHLTADEQYTQMSLWCLLAAPLLVSCDLNSLDKFTLSLLTNDEVIEVNQDPLGKAATRIKRKFFIQTEVWAKLLEDGAYAIGLFNRSSKKKKLEISWQELGLTGDFKVRDLWRQQDLGVFSTNFETLVNAHGVVLIKIEEFKH